MIGRKNDRKLSYKRLFFIGIITALFIFIIGFGVMWLFWIQAESSYYGDKGFFYWRAATWGDGLCLSLLVGSLLTYRMFLGEINQRHKIISFICGGTMGCLGVGVQASWIISDTTVPNWTIEVHHFMPSGWYHAGYFVFMLFIIFTLLYQVFFARRNYLLKDEFGKREYGDSLFKIIIWFSGLGYLFMNSIDDRFVAAKYMQQTIILLLTFMLFAFVYSFMSLGGRKVSNNNQQRENKKNVKKQIMSDVIAIAIGCFSAMGFGLSVYYGVSDFLTAFICAAFSIVYIKPDSENPTLTVFNIFKVILPTFLLVLAASNSNNLYHMVVLSLLAIFVPAIISPTPSIAKKYKYKILGMCFMALALIQSIVLSDFADTHGRSDLISNIISGVATFFCVYYIPLIFEENVVDKERANSENKKEVNKAIFITYSMMFFVGIGAVTMVVKSLSVAFFDYLPNISFDYVLDFTALNIILLGILILSIIILFTIWRFVKSRTMLVKGIVITLVLVSYLSIFLNLYSMKMTKFIGLNHWLEIAFAIIGLWVVACASVFVMIGFYENLVSIRGGSEDNSKVTRLCAIIIFVGCLVSCMISVLSIDTADYGASSIPRLGISIITVIVSVIILPTLSCVIIDVPENPQNDKLYNSPQSGVFHVGILMTGAMVVGALSELFTISLVSASLKEAENVLESWELLVACAFFIIIIYQVVSFCLKMNIKHMEDHINKSSQGESEQQSLYSLNKHLRKQNIMVVVMFAPYFIIPFIIKAFQYYFKPRRKRQSTNESSFLSELTDEFIPQKYNK